MTSDVKVVFYANSVTEAGNKLSESATQHEYFREIEVPHENFYEVHRVLTELLGAKYCSVNHMFIFNSKKEIKEVLEKIKHLLV